MKNYFLPNTSNIKKKIKIGAGITSVVNINNIKADYIPTLFESGKSVDNPCAIASIFNNFFVNCGKNIAKDIPCATRSPTSFLTGYYPEPIFLSPVTPTEIESHITQMDNNKSIGHFCIPVPLLKILKCYVAPILSSLTNDSFLSRTFPNKLNYA